MGSPPRTSVPAVCTNGSRQLRSTSQLRRIFTQTGIILFLQVFQGSGIGKMEDNLTSADPLSYTTNGSRGDLQILG